MHLSTFSLAFIFVNSAYSQGVHKFKPYPTQDPAPRPTPEVLSGAGEYPPFHQINHPRANTQPLASSPPSKSPSTMLTTTPQLPQQLHTPLQINLELHHRKPSRRERSPPSLRHPYSDHPIHRPPSIRTRIRSTSAILWQAR